MKFWVTVPLSGTSPGWVSSASDPVATGQRHTAPPTAMSSSSLPRGSSSSELSWSTFCPLKHLKKKKKKDLIGLTCALNQPSLDREILPSVHVASSPTVVPNNFPCSGERKQAQYGKCIKHKQTASPVLSAIVQFLYWYRSLHDEIGVSGSILSVWPKWSRFMVLDAF